MRTSDVAGAGGGERGTAGSRPRRARATRTPVPRAASDHLSVPGEPGTRVRSFDRREVPASVLVRERRSRALRFNAARIASRSRRRTSAPSLLTVLAAVLVLARARRPPTASRSCEPTAFLRLPLEALVFLGRGAGAPAAARPGCAPRWPSSAGVVLGRRRGVQASSTSASSRR